MKRVFLFIALLLFSNYGLADSGKSSSSSFKILALGDSLTEGYGVQPAYSYPGQLQAKLDKLGKGHKVINGGVSGSTTASGKSRLKWFLRAKPKIMILALGANDGLRGLKLSESKKNLEDIILMAKEHNILVIMAGMQMPPNYGEDYRRQFKAMFLELATKYELAMIPFLLEGIAGVKSLNIEDGIHPNKAGYALMVDTIMKTLKDYL